MRSVRGRAGPRRRRRAVAVYQRQVGRLDRDVGAGADAMPRSACARAGGVVDAVAHHRHHPALACSRRTTADLLRRQDLGDDLVDADLRGDGLRGGAVVAGEQDGRSPRGATRRRPRPLRLDHVGDREHRRRLPVPGRPRSPSGRGAARLGRRSQRGRECTARSASSAGRPTTTVAARRRRPDPSPSGSRSPRPAGKGPSCAARAATARATGCSEASSRPRQASARADRPRPPPRSTSVIRPVVTVPVLSRTTVSTRRGTRGSPGPDQQAELRAPAGADHERGRRREPEGARARDDERPRPRR